MEAPCVCDCGKVFDLDEGFKSNNSDKVICTTCNDEQEKQEEIESLIENIGNAQSIIKYSIDQLEKLGYDTSKI